MLKFSFNESYVTLLLVGTVEAILREGEIDLAFVFVKAEVLHTLWCGVIPMSYFVALVVQLRNSYTTAIYLLAVFGYKVRQNVVHRINLALVYTHLGA